MINVDESASGTEYVVFGRPDIENQYEERRSVNCGALTHLLTDITQLGRELQQLVQMSTYMLEYLAESKLDCYSSSSEEKKLILKILEEVKK